MVSTKTPLLKHDYRRQGKISLRKTKISSVLIGSLAKGLFRKVCGNAAESSQ